ncbi:alkaline phosphatase PhoX [Roseateles asaccharophilus]|uniref:alkaline phosphatase PhoX n=1 Tax=Roseateles asaccharophilus TaxID=582607 RepID=UPI00286A50C7|nr:alkaline phosphatase PhoX [Roseateles asaccharophilus]
MARRVAGKWTSVKSSPYGRRITSNTPMRIAGLAAGQAPLRTREYVIADTMSVATGNATNVMVCYGTVNNCANGITPWGAYLTCEENWNGTSVALVPSTRLPAPNLASSTAAIACPRPASATAAGTPPTCAGT